MALKLINEKAITYELARMGMLIESALVFNLEAAVADLVNHAKLTAGYNDQTSNLKSSIGGVVLKNGKPITYKGFVSEGGGATGGITGLEFVNSLIKDNAKGYVIILVAGMEYASYVEDYNGLNVLKRSELKMHYKLPVLLNKLKRAIDAN